MRLLTLTISAVGLGLLVGACGVDDRAYDPTDPPPIEDPQKDPQPDKVLQSKKPRNDAVEVKTTEMEQLVAGNNAFAWSLYQQLKEKAGGNLFYSPFSISQALAMTFAGARNNTEKQMSEALHFTLDQTRLHPAFNALDLALASRGSGAKGMDGEGFRLHIANAIWGQDGYGFVPDFLDVLAEHYGAGMRLLDFATDPEAARQVINEWVAGETENKIKDLLKEGDLTIWTRLVLTNAIYFNAAWAEVFPEELSGENPFHLLDGSTVTVPTMSHMTQFKVASGDGYQAVELPYDGEELSMVIVVPDAGRFTEVEKNLGTGLLSDVVGKLAPAFISLTLPKWKTTSDLALREQLEAMGMTDAFKSSLADFTGINGGVEPLWISLVTHKATITVNEKGTEAAAATAVVMSGGAMPEQLRVDRPFIFVIRDIPTGSILFVGRVLDPLE